MARVVVRRDVVAQYRRRENHVLWSEAAAKTGKAAIVAAAPFETGFLKQSFRTREFPGVKGPTVQYQAVPDYAIYPEVGTGLYGPAGRYITPKRAKLLSWISSDTGKRVFAKRVRGQRPRYYFRKGLVATFGERNVRYYGVDKINLSYRTYRGV